jgi:AraC family transcriptional regulator of adaptative response/methylated-DNA-[protein]-cysteine methyltransferase
MIKTTIIESPLGDLLAGATDEGICLLEFNDRKRALRESGDLSRLLNQPIGKGENIHLEDLRKQLDEYFMGARKDFDLPLVLPGTDFQRLVWNELRKISYGTTRSYMEQAAAIGSPDSVRAVANANGTNRVSIIIPCHRVIGSNGRLTGYGGGLARKKWLIDHEKRHSGQATEPELFT